MTIAANLIRNIPDFPKTGILFRDITPLLNNPAAFSQVIDELADATSRYRFSRIAGIESRGFIFGAPLSLKLGVGFVPIRKPGKLPARVLREEYSLEYGTNAVEMHADALTKGESVLIIDDLLATGGTAGAACRLVERAGGIVAACTFVIELEALEGRKALEGREVVSLITY
ncbi:MAG TPA: adenine phosphoribosyltransferase [Candidatus Latescibacteria bacterium]|nr:adenine phosphoribosyltransferase [Candidatus Latescibacterota bacterium]HOF60110.1 adenine phosphoribosyltransferase [Candidatus Latescibacterota bacterium]HOS63393.1 adenine phosphoribosyltransferase [Candidatus Latescibacterota bacterium]HPK75446.1 adenine phosphoribosyltransferase [Candidatus Latescibacterota bacterium]